MITTARKTLYHSELRTLCEDGPVRIQLLEEPRQSLYKNRECFCHIEVEGQESSRYLAIENEAIFGQLAALPLHQWLEVTAAGSRDAATLQITHTNGNGAKAEPTNRIARELEQVARETDAAPQSIARDYWNALEVATSMVETFQAKHGREPSEAERAIATTLFIQMNMSHGSRPLSA